MKNITKVLIANRGEIAVRIIRACRELNLPSVSVYSSGDNNALHRLIADESVCIGPPQSKDSYLNMHAIIGACKKTGADALHPGFGFLSESAEFAKLCADNGIKWIGPTSEQITALGDKANAKNAVKANGVPVIPGSDGIVADIDSALKLCDNMGYPVLVKASAGGGGRGIRPANNAEELQAAFTAAKAEAMVCFGDDGVYIEKLIQNPRHVEIQILADEYGNCVYLGERDCSCQRRRQKVLEESPSPAVDGTLRKAMGEAAVKAAVTSNYTNAGTVEFLLDKNKQFYFMEMNARIQVEHPVTEAVTGIDLIKAQISIADGEKLPFAQTDVIFYGHSIECRVNAENPTLNFRPSPGKITGLHLPGGFGVRVDTAVYQGYEIPPFYDNMLAKVIVHAKDRPSAIRKMIVALSEVLIDGVDTNVDFLLNLLKNDTFDSGVFDIGFVEEQLSDLV
ncbi:MAG: acetyl-CoA carboxylase biotin carboxylase subunit [Oscillospiraceae bacterium]|jgi:acetyl-CoA carboxylase biotin carboxylase subunit|nr:acetyl-CoA carboxylase biotin carboxylase subunit [Oscillospiraceae bacterium]